MTLAELKRLRAQKVGEARKLSEKAESENRAMEPDEKQQFDALMTEVEGLKARIATLESLADIEPPADEGDGEGRSSNPIDAGRRDAVPWRNPRHPFRILRALSLVMEGRALDGVEGETTRELEKRYQKKAQGFFLPMDLAWTDPERRSAARERRAFDTTAGTGTITTTLASDFVELLRARAALQLAGARILSDMQGNFALPRQTSGVAASWVNQGTAPSGGNQVTDQVPFTPRTLACFTDVTRALIKQSSADVEAFVKLDLAKSMALGVDAGGINGSGVAPQPLGLLQDPAVPTIAIGANGGAPTWDHLVALETAVGDANADLGSLAYITNSQVRGKLKRSLVDNNVLGVRIWGYRGINSDVVNDEVNGYQGLVSNSVPKNLTKGSGTNLSAILFGNFEDLAIALWGPVDVLVDPYTGSSSGTVRIVNLQEADIHPRHPASFAKIVDAVTT